MKWPRWCASPDSLAIHFCCTDNGRFYCPRFSSRPSAPVVIVVHILRKERRLPFPVLYTSLLDAICIYTDGQSMDIMAPPPLLPNNPPPLSISYSSAFPPLSMWRQHLTTCKAWEGGFLFMNFGIYLLGVFPFSRAGCVVSRLHQRSHHSGQHQDRDVRRPKHSPICFSIETRESWVNGRVNITRSKHVIKKP